MSQELDVVSHFSDAIICLISSALVGGNVHKLGKDSTRKSLKVAGGGSILEDIFLPILEKCLFSFTQWFLLIRSVLYVSAPILLFFVFVEIISLVTFQFFWHHFYSFQILIYSSFVLGILWGELFYFCKICTWLKLMGCLLITFFYTRHSF